MASVTPRTLNLALFIVDVLKEDDSYDSPYIDADHLRDVVIDGRVDLVALAGRIDLWMSGASHG